MARKVVDLHPEAIAEGRALMQHPGRVLAVRAAMALALCGCGGDGMGLGPTASSGCALPLSQYCSNLPCPSYQDSAAQVRALANSPGCVDAVIGACPTVRYTRVGDGFTSTTLFFGTDDRVVAVDTTTDALVPGSSCGGKTHYGSTVDCDPPAEMRCGG
jgi:hypothetical protein